MKINYYQRKQIKSLLIFLHNNNKISPQPYYAENLGIQYLAASLRVNGFEVQAINADYDDIEFHEIVRKSSNENINFIGLSPCYINMESALNIANEIKKQFPAKFICLGGHHATFCCDDILENEDNIDFIIRGEGEATIAELVQALESSINNKLSIKKLLSIRGLSFRYNGEVHHNQDRAVEEDLDKLPFPIRDQLETIIENGKYAMPLICTTRGCPSNCSFCSTPSFWGQKWRARSPKNVVDEIQQIIERYRLTHFYVTDDQIAGSGERGREHIKGIIQELKLRGLNKAYDLHFFLMLRGDFFNKTNEDIICQFPDVGFRDVFIGFESGASSNLKMYTKGTSNEQYVHAIDILRKYNIFVEGGFILFNPYSTFFSLRKDAQFIKNLGVPLFGYYTKELMALPGTRLYDRLLQDDMFLAYGYKQITFKYKDIRIRSLHEYISGLFSGLEVTENLLFKSIDFQIKLKSIVYRLHYQLRAEAISFIETADKIYEEINRLNYNFFNNVLSIFEDNGAKLRCATIETKYKKEYLNLFNIVHREHLALSSRLNHKSWMEAK